MNNKAKDVIDSMIAGSTDPVAYISGPMRGKPRYNFDWFEDAAGFVRQLGYNVVSPHDVDLACGFNPDIEHEFIEEDTIEFMERDSYVITHFAKAIFMLPGWEKSLGATAERAMAIWKGIDVRYIYFGEQGITTYFHSPIPSEEDILDEAMRLTKGDRQAQYGPPDQDFKRIAGIWNSMFGYMLKGEFQTYHVAQAMIGTKLSRLQHSRKRDSVVDIAGYARCMDICYKEGGGYQK